MPSLVMPTSPQITTFARPLDMIFFTRPTQDPISAAIQGASLYFFGKTPYQWSHVGIIVSRRVMPSLIALDSSATDDTLYVWESTLSSPRSIYTLVENIPDAESGKYRFGVQIRRLDSILSACHSVGVGVGIGTLSDKCRGDLVVDMSKLQSTLDTLHSEFRNAVYQKNPLRIACAFCPSCQSSRQDMHVLFASQFVSLIYQRLGIIPEQVFANAMLPIELAYPVISDDQDFVRLCANGAVFNDAVLVLAPGKDTSLGGVIRQTITSALRLGVKLLIALAIKQARKEMRDSRIIRNGLYEQQAIARGVQLVCDTQAISFIPEPIVAGISGLVNEALSQSGASAGDKQ